MINALNPVAMFKKSSTLEGFGIKISNYLISRAVENTEFFAFYLVSDEEIFNFDTSRSFADQLKSIFLQ